ncbi:damage-inducible protein J [Photobacterium sanguinicancri]|uniref:damage-inducible protein J n=1 Tax=Photobacterium sanguinicancri TaxID=875932 RepID=UPI0026E45D81|nr:damage-inducible protein J [Photobacterium sanguinicancri]MDO6501183.1 damage-inducible protein J [Photobacterium sanguinicancri]
MDTRIQFRVDENTKKLAQITADRRGTTLSDECRKLTESLALEQRAIEEQDSWLAVEINKAYERFESGLSEFVSDDEADDIMNAKKRAIRAKFVY